MSTMSRIDGSCFPHIVEGILDHLCDSDPLTASNLQTICRKWYAKIKKRLFTHLWMDCRLTVFSSYSAPPTLSFNIGTVPPGRGRSLRFAIRLSHIRREPDRVAAVICHSLVLAALGSARVIDARCPDPLCYIPRDAAPVPMLRLGPGCAHTRTPLPDSEVLVISEYPDKGHSLSSFLSSTPSITSVVIDTDERDYALTGFFRRDGDLPETLQTVTVFYPFRPYVQIDRTSFYDRIMASVIEAIDKDYSDGRKLTLVSPDTSLPRYHYLLKRSEASWRYLKNRLESEALHLLDNVEFLTTVSAVQ